MSYHANGHGPTGDTGVPARGRRGPLSLYRGKTKVTRESIPFDATYSKKVYSIDTGTDTMTAIGTTIPNRIICTNTGAVPLMTIVGYREWSGHAASSSADYLHTLLLPGQSFSPPVRGIISSAGDKQIFGGGTIITNEAPDSNMYLASGATSEDRSGADITGSSSSTNIWLKESDWTSATNGSHLLFYPGDRIRVNDEIMEVTAVGDGSTSNGFESANNYLTVIRGVHGSTAASDHADGAVIRFPFFNAYQDFGKYSVSQTDSAGNFKAYNLFGKGRASTGVSGIVPGSLNLKFFDAGWIDITKGGGLSSNQHTGLAVNTEYGFSITCDGAAEVVDVSITTDSSDTSFGSLITLFQSELNKLFYTAGGMFEKRAYIGISPEGNLRITSGQRLSTSSIRLANPTGVTNLFGVGRIPAAPTSVNATDGKLPDDLVYDPITDASSPNDPAIAYDNGSAQILGAASGQIFYETGMINMRSFPNSEFVFSCMHTSAFSGKINEATAGRQNCLLDIYANTTNQKRSGSILIETI